MHKPACSAPRRMTPIESARGPKEKHIISLFRFLPLLVVLNSLLVAGFDSASPAADLSSPQGEGASPARASSEQQEKQEEQQRPTGIVIMAQGRSGSTMLGETFRQNKDVLYWYEPCRSWGVGLFDSSGRYHREIHGEECAALVRRLALCEFTLRDSARLGVDPKALDSGSPTLSPLRAAYDNPSADALARAHEVVIDTCKRSRAVVVKTIRADAGIGGGDRNAGGVLVVHLVRDPRAVIHSQIKTFNVGHKYRRYFKGPPVLPPEEAGAAAAAADDRSPGGPAGGTNATQQQQQQQEGGYLPWGGEGRARALGHIICGVYRDQLDSSSELNSRYIRVRYEDIAAAADATVKRVYDWAGLGAVPARVSLWINENTRVPDCDDHDSVAAANERENDRAMTETATSHGSGTGGGGGGGGSGSDVARLRAAEEEVMAAIGGRGARARRALASDGGSGGGGGGGSGGGQGSGQGSGGHQEDQRHVSCKEMMAKQVEWDRYGTRRHSAAMVGLWRTQMPAREAAAVWEACASSGVLEEMGYAQ